MADRTPVTTERETPLFITPGAARLEAPDLARLGPRKLPSRNLYATRERRPRLIRGAVTDGR
jgi:hypothetical protein